MRTFCFLLLICVSACSVRAAQPPEVPPARLFTGPIFVTQDAQVPEARAILVDSEGRIQALYADIPANVDAQTVTLPGALAVPGLHDGHMHIEGLGLKLTGLDLSGTQSAQEVRERTRDYIARHPEAEVIRGFGWDQSLFPGQAFPSGADIAGLTDKPVYLLRTDGHAAIANSAALKLARIGSGPPGRGDGSVIRDPDGQPTGLILDGAVLRMERALPPVAPEELEARLRTALQAAADVGVTSVHEMGLFGPVADALLRLQETEELPVRVFAYMAGTDFPWLLRNVSWHPRRSRSMGNLEFMGIKLMIDGAMGSRGAMLLEPYSDDPDNRGHAAYGLLLQRSVYQVAQALGWQVAVHAIGDEANQLAIRWIEQYPSSSPLPARVEHAQLLSPADFARFADVGAVASMQPAHVADDLGWAADRLGPVRAAGAYAWRSHHAAGAVLAFGSDAPVSDLRPARGFHAALTRQTPEGDPPEGWYPGQRLDFETTLQAYTTGPAHAVGRGASLGRLSPGYRFDVTVFQQDCRLEPSCWLEAEVTATVLDGKVRQVHGNFP